MGKIKMNKLLCPQNTKLYNTHNYKLKNIKRNNMLHHGNWGIVVVKEGIITSNQLEASRCILSKNIKNIGKLWIKIFPNYTITKKPKDSRMGSGKGKYSSWVYVARPGDIIFEATILPLASMVKICKLIKNKLSVKIKLIYKKNNEQIL